MKWIKEHKVNTESSSRTISFRYSYGRLAVIFLLLAGIFSRFGDKWPFKSFPYPFSMFLIFLITTVEIALGLASFYFFILWIMKLVRSRGGIERPENKKTKKIITIIFIILLLGEMISIGLPILQNISSTEVSSEQTSFANELLGKLQEFSDESDEVRIAMQSFADVVQNKEYSKMQETLKNLLTAAQALEPKIDELKAFSRQGTDLSKDEKAQAVFNLYLKAIDLRDQNNKKWIELATFGLTIDWENITEAQTAKWKQLSRELGAIESEIQDTQIELQNTLKS